MLLNTNKSLPALKVYDAVIAVHYIMRHGISLESLRVINAFYKGGVESLK